MEFLRFQVNSTSLHLALPEQNVWALIHQQLVSVRDLVRFVGKVTATVRAIWQAPPALQSPSEDDKFGGISEQGKFNINNQGGKYFYPDGYL